MGIEAFRVQRLTWHRNGWREPGIEPLLRGLDSWRLWSQPAPWQVEAPKVPVQPFGVARWPVLPPKTVKVEVVNRAGETETWWLRDPAKMQPAGAVTYDGFPRSQQGAHVIRDVWVGPGRDDRGDVTIPGNRIVRSSELIAANPGTNLALDGGRNLRTLCQLAHAEGQSRGKVWPYLVVDTPGDWYVPDFTHGFHAGVQLGPGQFEIGGIVGVGPQVRIAIAPSCKPSTTIMVDGTITQLKSMRKDGGATNVYPTIIFADKLPVRPWFANWAGVHTPLTDPTDGAELHWQGLKVSNCDLGAVAERLTCRGFSAGWANVPPGETDIITFIGCDNITERWNDLDGRSLDGVRRATSHIGHNGSYNRTTGVVTPVANVWSEGNRISYGRAGMQTFWLTQDIVSVFDEVYSTAAGVGKEGSGSGANFEEAKGRIRVFFRSVTQIGGNSDETGSVDKTTNMGMWCGFQSTKKFGGDAAVDAIIYEPRWGSRDYRLRDPQGRLVIACSLNVFNADGTVKGGYHSDEGWPAQNRTHPIVYIGGRRVTTGDNIRLDQWVEGVSQSFSYYGTAPGDVVIFR